MIPIKMTYQESDKEKPQDVLVYDISHTHDLEGNLAVSFVTAWKVKQKQWIVAPLWEFKPVLSKQLKEEVK